MSESRRDDDDFEIDPGLESFAALLRTAAPQPSPDFERRLIRAQAALKRRNRRRQAMFRLDLWRARHPVAAAALAAVALLAFVGAALALSAALAQLIRQDAGLRAVFDSDQGTELNLSQTIGDYTVTLKWAYADGNRLTVGYTIAGAPGVEYTNLQAFSNRLLLQGAPPVELPGMFGVGNVFSYELPYASNQVGNVSAHSYTFDLTVLDPVPNVLNLRLELEVYGVTVLKRTQIPDPSDEALWGHGTPFVFEFSLPVDKMARVLAEPQTATDQGIAITLKRVTVTPSQTRLVLCYEAPDPTRQWTLIPHLTASGELVEGGGGVREVASEAGQTCNEFVYNAAMDTYHGGWELEITEMVGFGSGGGDDQQRIAGGWRFAFHVP